MQYKYYDCNEAVVYAQLKLIIQVLYPLDVKRGTECNLHSIANVYFAVCYDIMYRKFAILYQRNRNFYSFSLKWPTMVSSVGAPTKCISE